MVQTIDRTVKIDFGNDNTVLSCLECNGPIISDDFRGDTVCEDCGLIHSEKACDTANFGKNIYSAQDDYRKSTYGAPQSIFIPDISFQTIIKPDNTHDSDFNRLVKWDTRSKTDRNKSKLTSFKELKKIFSNLDLPTHVGECAVILFKKAYSLKLLRGSSIEALVCACLYFACRKYELPITLNDLLNQSNAKIKRVKNNYRSLLKTFNLKVKPLTPQHFVSRYVNELGLGLQIEKKVSKVISQLPYNFINGQNPKRICAGTIYFVSKLNNQKTLQREIAKVCDVSEVGLRYAWKEISKVIKI